MLLVVQSDPVVLNRSKLRMVTLSLRRVVLNYSKLIQARVRLRKKVCRAEKCMNAFFSHLGP